MLNIVIFGPPGSGKGTQSVKLLEKYQLVHLSTGDILRNEIANGTLLGQEAKILMDQGILVPDGLVISMINGKLEKNANAKGFVFDGFPRTTAQAIALDRLLASKGKSITLTLALEVSNDELTKRILQRGEEMGRPDDQDESTIRTRIAEYTNKTAPLKEYYAKQHKFHGVSGVGTIDDIFHSLCNVINKNYLSETISSGSAEQVSTSSSIVSIVSSVSEKVNKPVAREIKPVSGPEIKMEKPAPTNGKIVEKVNPTSIKPEAKPASLKKASAPQKAAPSKKVTASKKAGPSKKTNKVAKKKAAKPVKKAAVKKNTKKVVKKSSPKKKKLASKKLSSKKKLPAKKSNKKSKPVKKVVKKKKVTGKKSRR